MTDCFNFTCPNCKYSDEEQWWGVPVGETIACPECKKRFMCMVEFKEVEEKVKRYRGQK